MVSIYRRIQWLAGVAVAVASVTLLSTAHAGRIPAGLPPARAGVGSIGCDAAATLTQGYLMVFQLARNGGATVEQADFLASQATAADVKKALGQRLQQTQQNGRPFCEAFQ